MLILKYLLTFLFVFCFLQYISVPDVGYENLWIASNILLTCIPVFIMAVCDLGASDE